MNPENIEAIKTALAPVAEKIGQGSEYGWEAIVQGQVAEGVGNIVIAVWLIVVIIIGYFLAKKVNENLRGFEVGIPLMAWFFFTGLTILFILASLYNGTLHLVAPEYKAIEFLISLGQK